MLTIFVAFVVLIVILMDLYSRCLMMEQVIMLVHTKEQIKISLYLLYMMKNLL